VRIAARAIAFRHPGAAALFEDVDFELRPGRLTAVVGPSGSGKSTLLSVVAGFRRPTAGEVLRDGVDRAGWVLQNPAGVSRRTVIDQVAQPYLYRGMGRTEAVVRADELLGRFKLNAVRDRQFRRLSGGEAQRLAFARGAASQPDVLLLDEPTAQLDQSTAGTLRGVIRELVSDQRIVMVATHDPLLVAECDDVLDLTEHRAEA
jgi:lipoprotein-releasing system ATP-binding protein